MEAIAKSLIILSGVILIVSIVYIIALNRTKEKLAMIEKNMDPSLSSPHNIFSNTLKIGFLFIGAGLGFITALLVDEFLLSNLDNPAIYPGCILLFAGIGIVLYHQFYK